jgi:hypothetical protein
VASPAGYASAVTLANIELMQQQSAREYHLIYTGWCFRRILRSSRADSPLHAVTPDALRIDRPWSCDSHFCITALRALRIVNLSPAAHRYSRNMQGQKKPQDLMARQLCRFHRNLLEDFLVPGTGLEPASCEAADFKSAMFTNFITPAGGAIARGGEFYHCPASAPNWRSPATILPACLHICPARARARRASRVIRRSQTFPIIR